MQHESYSSNNQTVRPHLSIKTKGRAERTEIPTRGKIPGVKGQEPEICKFRHLAIGFTVFLAPSMLPKTLQVPGAVEMDRWIHACMHSCLGYNI